MRSNQFLKACAVLCMLVLLLSGCNDTSPAPSAASYSATIAAGRAVVKDVMDESKATALSVALTDGDRIIWSESFGVIDKVSNKAAETTTMFGIASVSKMLATVAAMILVDQGKLSLDAPLVTYLSDFNMLSPEYKDVTVRMLLNHSSGFPGTDERNAQTIAPYPEYAVQALEGLTHQRLKHAPGYMNIYCNDGFTMVENLVRAISGKSYSDFVEDEILIPLGMSHSRFPTAVFPEASYARVHAGSTPSPFTFFNMYASGGVYSTAEDMSRLAAMLMKGGVYGSRRILSERSVAAMSQDQTIGSFNPLPSDSWRFGLGWDTVTQPGLKTSGIRGWQKGGDFSTYGAAFMIAPDERLAVTVLGVSNGMTSTGASKIAEKVLLAALVERGRLSGFPAQMQKDKPLPAQNPTDDDKKLYAGYYATYSDQLRISYQPDNSLDVANLKDGTWQVLFQGLKLRTDGWYASDADAVTAIRFLTQGGRSYCALRQPSGNGYYPSLTLGAQKLSDLQSLSDAWQTRLSETWLKVNDDYYSSLPETDTDPRLSLATHKDLAGYIIAGSSILRDMNPPSGARLDGMILQIPQILGRDLMDVGVEIREGQEWLRFGTTLYRPLSGTPALPAGQTSVTIGSGGFAEWRRLPATGSISINGAAAWKVLGQDFARRSSGTGNGSAQLTSTGGKYLMLYGSAGTAITLNMTTP